MSAAPQWYQFTIARMLHATFWFAVTVALVGAAIRTPIINPVGPPPGTRTLIILELGASALAFGCAVGAIFGRPFRGAIIAAALVAAFMLLA